MNDDVKYHFWVGKRGCVWSTTLNFVMTFNDEDKMKYMGHADNPARPVRLNTGRVLLLPELKDKRN